MVSREINILKKMRENIIRRHTDAKSLGTASTSTKWYKDWNRIVNIDKKLKALGHNKTV